MEYNFGKFLKDAKKDKKEHERELDQRGVHKENIKEKLRSGTLQPVRRKIGRGFYKPKAKDFVDIEELKGTLKDTSGNVGSMLRDQYDNVFRTGKIEPVREGRNKQRKHRLYKAHNIYETSMQHRQIMTRGEVQKEGNPDLVIL